MTKSNQYNPHISVDCAVFGFANDQLNVLLIRRKQFINVKEQQFAIPGDLVYTNESLDEAAARILYDLTNLKDIFLDQFYTFGNPNRLNAAKDQEWLEAFRKEPKARVITVGYFALVRAEDYTPIPSSFAGESKWTPINEVPELAFDHNQILTQALAHLRAQLQTNQVGWELLPKKFTLSELQSLYETILDTQLDTRNFRKSVKKKPYLKELNETKQGMAHRPAKLYTYKKEQSLK